MYPFRPSDMSFVEDYRLSTCLHLRIKARQAARLQKQAVQRSNGVVLFFSNIRLRSHPKDSAFHARLCVRFRPFSIPQRHIPNGHIILRHFPFFAKLVPVLRIEYFLRAPNVACAHPPGSVRPAKCLLLPWSHSHTYSLFSLRRSSVRSALGESCLAGSDHPECWADRPIQLF